MGFNFFKKSESLSPSGMEKGNVFVLFFTSQKNLHDVYLTIRFKAVWYCEVKDGRQNSAWGGMCWST
jgi:hypothetical protein